VAPWKYYFGLLDCSPKPPAKRERKKQPALETLWLHRQIGDAYGAIAACADAAHVQAFEKYFVPAMDACLQMKKE
jgi:hypothetical protein